MDTKDDLIEKVFPTLGKENNKQEEFISASIYTPLNIDAKEINDLCLEQMPGTSRLYLSADSILEDDHKDVIPPEFLNTIAISGMADHNLTLKIGCPVILLRNLQE